MAQYEESAHKTYKIADDGERILLANFTAWITEEIRYIDGRSTETYLTVAGHQNNPDDENPFVLPPVTVSASAFVSMAWILSSWGVRAVLSPGSGVKEDMRTAIQLHSKPKIQTIYKMIGWEKINGKPTYLHAAGGITDKGNDPNHKVMLPPELSHFSLTVDPKQVKAAVAATLRLTQIAPPEIAWPMFAATFTPLLGPVDFAMHITGRTGTFKSELTSLFQSAYGAGMDARSLPGSWSSTANALEAQAFIAKNAVFVVDDFVPSGSSWQVRAYQTTADKIIRSQGNQAGRARLTDTSNLQATMYPRGMILSTGEDTPEGHSIRARMMIIELTPGDVEPAKLTAAQKARPLYSIFTAAFVQWLAGNPQDADKLAKSIRPQFLDIGHARTPSMLTTLLATIEIMATWMQAEKLLKTDQANNFTRQAGEAIKKAAEKQTIYLESADPCDVFTSAFRQAFNAGLAHVRTMQGGVPRSATILGWTEEGGTGDIPTYKSHGPCVGWVAWDEGELYIDITTGWIIAKKVSGSELPITKQTMFKRLKDAGCLTRTDETRQRNTIRITAEGHPRQVLSFAIPAILETNEVPQ